MTFDFCLDSDIAEIVDRLGEEAFAFEGKTVLLCGAQGFLGRYFIACFEQLNSTVLKQPCTVIALDNFITRADGQAVETSAHVVFHRHDITRPFVYEQGIDFIIHAAGIASPFYYRAYPLETLEVSTTGTRNLLELAVNKQARLLFFSSSEIYGDPDPKHVPTQESYRGNVASQGPRACYDESKRLGETYCHVFHEKFGTHTNAVRPFNVYGPGMPEKDYRVLPNFASRIKAGRKLSVYGSGNQTRTFCYVTDALLGFFKVVLRGVPGETYNVGNPKPEISVLDLVKHIEAALGHPVDYDVIEYPDSYPADEPMRRCPDIRKAQLQLDFTPRVDLEDGLRRFFAWTDGAYRGEV